MAYRGIIFAVRHQLGLFETVMRLRHGFASFLFCYLSFVLSFSSGGLAVAPPAYASTDSSVSGDVTDSLRLVQGLTVTFHIYEGLDSKWHEIGDYDFVARIEEAGKDGFIYDWQMSEPASGYGSRRVEAGDIKHARKVSLFYPKHEVCTLVGYTNILRISDDLYRDLKEGKRSDFALDGPDSVIVLHAETVPMPHLIQGQGLETVTIKVEGKDVPLRCIKAVCDNGWTYWVLDNPHLPLIVQGNAPFRWVASLGNTNGDGAGDANKEAKNIIDQLRHGGVATSYLILFDFDSDRLKDSSKAILKSLSTYLRKDAELRLQVEGHTCIIGGYNYNMDLSRRRAKSVKRFLVEDCGIAEYRLRPVGYGYTRPERSNATATGRARNRRVVFREIK